MPDYESPADANADNTYEIQLFVKYADGISSKGKALTISVTDMAQAHEMYRLFPVSNSLTEASSGGVVPVVDIGRCKTDFFDDPVAGINYQRILVYVASKPPADNRSQYINDTLFAEYSFDALVEQTMDSCGEVSWLEKNQYFALPDSFYLTAPKNMVDIVYTQGSTYEFEFELLGELDDLPVVNNFNPQNIIEKGFRIGLWNDQFFWVVDKLKNKVISRFSLPEDGVVEFVGFGDDNSLLLMTGRISGENITHEIFKYDAFSDYDRQTIMENIIIDGVNSISPSNSFLVFEESGVVKVKGLIFGACTENPNGTPSGLRYFTIENESQINYLDEEQFACSREVEAPPASSPTESVEDSVFSLPISSKDGKYWSILMPLRDQLSCDECEGPKDRYAFSLDSSNEKYRYQTHFEMIDATDNYYDLGAFQFTCISTVFSLFGKCDFPNQLFYINEAGAIQITAFKNLWTDSPPIQLSGENLKSISIDIDEENHLLYALGTYGENATPVLAVIHYLTGAASYLPLASLLQDN